MNPEEDVSSSIKASAIQQEQINSLTTKLMEYKRRLRNFQIAEDNLKKEVERLQNESSQQQYDRMTRESGLLNEVLASEISAFDDRLKGLVGDSLIEEARASQRQAAVIDSQTSTRPSARCFCTSSANSASRTAHLTGLRHRTAQR